MVYQRCQYAVKMLKEIDNPKKKNERTYLSSMFHFVVIPFKFIPLICRDRFIIGRKTEENMYNKCM